MIKKIFFGLIFNLCVSQLAHPSTNEILLYRNNILYDINTSLQAISKQLEEIKDLYVELKKNKTLMFIFKVVTAIVLTIAAVYIVIKVVPRFLKNIGKNKAPKDCSVKEEKNENLVENTISEEKISCISNKEYIKTSELNVNLQKQIMKQVSILYK